MKTATATNTMRVFLQSEPSVSLPGDAELTSLAKRVNDGADTGSPGGAGVVFVERHPFGPTTQVEKYALSNGLTVLLSVDRAAPVIAYQTWFDVGSRHERPGKTGIAHLFEHMMFKSTRTTPEGEFDRLMEEAGVSNNASTWVDWTYYREKLPRRALPLVVRLEADRMENLVLEEEPLESERSVVMNERHLRVENDPAGKMFEVLFSTAFEKHPYRWPTIGWMDDIAGLTLEDCREFYRLFYSPNNATIVVVGDLEREETLRLIREHYGHLEAQPVPDRATEPEPEQTAGRRRVLHLPLSAPRLVAGYKSPALGDPDLPALEIANETLFNGDSSRIERLLVTDEEIASSVYGWVASFTHPGLYEVFLTLKEDADPEEAEKLLYDELDRFTREGPTEAELEKARNRLEADLIRGTLTVGARAGILGTFEATYGDYKYFFEIVDAYRKVEAADVRRAARRFLRPERRTVVLAQPASAASPTDTDTPPNDTGGSPAETGE